MAVKKHTLTFQTKRKVEGDRHGSYLFGAESGQLITQTCFGNGGNGIQFN